MGENERKYSIGLIQQMQAYFLNERGTIISDETAVCYLDALADLFASFYYLLGHDDGLNVFEKEDTMSI